MSDNSNEPRAMNAIDKLLSSKPRVINVGLASFSSDLKKAGVGVVQVNWTPPPVTNSKIASLLSKLSS